MGLDIYVGSLSRYTLGDWLTIVQQALGAEGVEVQVVRTEPEPADAVTDPVVVADAVRSWQSALLGALGCSSGWCDSAELPYWTDKPDWDGYGGLLLLASYDEHPELAPGTRQGVFRKTAPPDAPREWQESPAFQRAAGNPERYTSLLSGVEWWLPVDCGPAVFEGPTLTGRSARMGRVDQLLAELRQLAARVGIDSEAALEQIRQEGPRRRTRTRQPRGVLVSRSSTSSRRTLNALNSH